MVEHTKPIAESNHFIVLDKYSKEWEAVDGYQSEDDLEREQKWSIVFIAFKDMLTKD